MPMPDPTPDTRDFKVLIASLAIAVLLALIGIWFVWNANRSQPEKRDENKAGFYERSDALDSQLVAQVAGCALN
jgi:hypothetical protein